MELGNRELSTEYSFHSVTCLTDKSVDATAHYTRLSLRRCIQWFYSNSSSSSSSSSSFLSGYLETVELAALVDNPFQPVNW